MISRFRSRYMELFGAVAGDDPLYEAVSEGVSYAGAEHWLPLFYGALETLFDYAPGRDHHARSSRRPMRGAQRLEQIEDHYRGPQDGAGTGFLRHAAL